MPHQALREAVAELNRARTSLNQAVERGASADAIARAKARLAAAEARVVEAQDRVRRATG